jgi:parallel beta-helix repeat protein
MLKFASTFFGRNAAAQTRARVQPQRRLRLERLEDRLAPATLNVGPGQQYATIGAAVSAAHNSGDTILVFPGTYTEQVTLPSRFTGLTLQSKTPNQAIIQAPTTLTGSQAIVDVQGATGIVLNGFTITTGPTRPSHINAGVYVEQAGSATIENGSITNIQDAAPGFGFQEGYGVKVGSTLPGHFGTGTATVTNEIITGYQKDGVLATNSKSSVNVTNSTITGVGATALIAQNGVDINSGATGTVSGNHISGNVYTGAGSVVGAGVLLYQPGSNVSVTGNNVSASDMGILVLDAASPTISNNNVSGSTFIGIDLDTAGGAGNSGAMISNNNSNNNGSDGISLAFTSSSTVANNNTNSNGSTSYAANGISLFSNVTGCTISNNSSGSNFGDGIEVYDSTSSGNTITGNSLSSNKVFDAADFSVGKKTGGTANTWSNNSFVTTNNHGLK